MKHALKLELYTRKIDEIGGKRGQLVFQYTVMTNLHVFDFYEGKVSKVRTTDQNFRHVNIEQLLRDSVFTILTVLDSDSNVLGDFVFDHSRQRHDSTNWMSNGDLVLENSRNFYLNEDSRGHVLFDPTAMYNKEFYFVVGQRDVGCNLEFGWFSVMCLKGNERCAWYNNFVPFLIIHFLMIRKICRKT